MASETQRIHVFIICFPVQGLINPLLRLGKRLASTGGFLVTFATTAQFGQKIIKATGISSGELFPIGDGFLRFEFIDDVGVDMNSFNCPPDIYLPQLESVCRKNVPRILRRVADEGCPVSCLINSSITTWAYDVAAELGIPIATMWAQSCASFLSFLCYYNKLVPFPSEADPYTDVEIPSLPLLKWDELHSFLHPTSTCVRFKKPWLGEFGNLSKPFCILIDTFDELEHNIIEFTAKLCPIIKPVGPLFKDPTATTAAAIRGDQIKADFDCLRWLDSKPRNSVVYISFGSIAHLKQEQIDEIAHGVLNAGTPFLWVMKPPTPNEELKQHTLPDGFVAKVGNNGRLVEFSPQEKVLEHPSVGWFMSHCGWNSTMEALASGVPIVAFPQWGDQLTNAKFLVDVFVVAVRMGGGEHEGKVIPREEVERCIREATVGPKAELTMKNALAFKEKAEKAYKDGGSSYNNVESLVDEIRRRSGAAVDKHIDGDW